MAETTTEKRRPEEDLDEGTKYKRFKVTLEGEDSKWSLPATLEEYLKENFEKYIPDKNIKESILTPNPRPDNMVSERKLDGYLHELLKERKKSQELAVDATLEKVQNKTDDIMGPLARLWTSVNEVVTGGDSEDNRLHVVEALHLIEQTILLIGQTHNTILYERRKNVLGAILPGHQVAATLREKAELLSKDDQHLFGKEFQDHVMETSKARRKSLEAFSIVKAPSSSSPTSSASFRTANRDNRSTPFRQGPLQHHQYTNRRDSGRGRGYSSNRYPNNGGYPKSKCLSPFRGKSTFQQHINSSTNEPGQTKSGSPDGLLYVFPFKSPKHSIGREAKTVSSCMENSDSRSIHPEYSNRFSNPFRIETLSKQNSYANKNGPKQGIISGQGNTRNVVEGCHTGDIILQRGVHQQSLHSTKKGRGQSTCDKFKSLESIPTIRALQDGGSALPKRPYKTWRLFLQNRLEGCIFQHSFGPQVTKICTLYLEREALRIRLPVLWAFLGPKNFHKIIKGADCTTEKTEHKSNHLSRRPAHYGRLEGGTDSGKGHSYIPSATSRVCVKSEEMCLNSHSRDSVFRTDCELEGVDFIIDSRKDRKDFKSLQEPIDKERDNSPELIKDNRFIIVSGTGSNASETPISISPAPAGAVNEEVKFFPNESHSVRRDLKRTELVGEQLSVLQWETSDSKEVSSHSANRCLQERLGCILPRDKNRRSLELTGRESSHKPPGTDSHKLWSESGSQCQTKPSLSCSGRQYFSPDISDKDGGIKITRDDKDFKGNMGFFNARRDHDYCRISTWDPEHLSRLGVQKHKGPSRMETMPNDIPRSVQKDRDSVGRSICIPTVASGQQVFCLETRSILPSGRCSPTTLATSETTLCFPPFVLINRILRRIKNEETNQVILIAPVWQAQTWYPQLLQMSCQQPLLLPEKRDLLRSPLGQFHPLVVQRSLSLAAWIISGRTCKQEDFRSKLPNLSYLQNDQVQTLITNRPGRSGLAGVVNNKLIHFNVM